MSKLRARADLRVQRLTRALRGKTAREPAADLGEAQYGPGGGEVSHLSFAQGIRRATGGPTSRVAHSGIFRQAEIASRYFGLSTLSCGMGPPSGRWKYQ